MPIVSKAQQRWAYWAKAHAKGSEQKAAADYVAAGPKGGSFSKLPAKKKGGYMAVGGGGKRRFGSL